MHSRGRQLENSVPESEEVSSDECPILGMHSKTLGIPPTRTRPGREHNIHSMLAQMREDSSSRALTEKERTANQGSGLDPIQYEKTMAAAKQFALQERHRNNQQPERQGELPDKKSKKKDISHKEEKKKQKNRPFTSQQMKALLNEDKENMTPETQKELIKQQLRNSNHLLKLSTQGDLKGAVNRTVAPAYRIRPGPKKAEVRDWTSPSQPYVPSVSPAAPPPPSLRKEKAQTQTQKPSPNCSYWTGDSNQDDQTLLNLLQKHDPNKEKKQVRFDLQTVKQVRFNIPDINENNSQEKAQLHAQKTKKIPLRLHLQNENNNNNNDNNGSPVNAVLSLNYFTEVWTLLEDLFSDETILWMNDCTDEAETEAESMNIFSTSAQTMASLATPESRRRGQLLVKGFEHAEILFNIPKPGTRLKTTESKGIHRQYGLVKEKLLAQAFHSADFSSESSSCFTEKYSKHWTFLCCLLTDAILRKRVLRHEYELFDAGDDLWENEKPENSRVCLWESKFEGVVGEVLGGELAAGQLLCLREFSLLRQYFDVILE